MGPRRERHQVSRMYEWVPASIVAGTFILGLVAESIEAGRLRRFAARVRRA